MALSYYSTTRPGALSVAMNSSTTTVPLVSAATFPDPTGPGNSEYTIIIGYGSDREEVCTVTAKVGDTLTVIRGQDSTAATGKNQGDVVVHGVSARDFKTFITGTDPRLTNNRPPTAHASNHASFGVDPLTPTAIGAPTNAEMAAAIAAVNASLAAAVPIGVILMWSGSFASIPTPTWRLCDGNWGTPNLMDRFIVGAGASYTVGASGGAASVALTIAQIPNHDHGGSTNTETAPHQHNIGSLNSANRGLNPAGLTGGGINGFLWGDEGSWTGTESAPHAHAIYAQGGGTAHENRPPYYALAYIMKVA